MRFNEYNKSYNYNYDERWKIFNLVSNRLSFVCKLYI